MTTLLYLQSHPISADASSAGNLRTNLTKFAYWPPGACAIQVRTIANGPGVLYIKAGQAQERAEIPAGESTLVSLAVNVGDPAGRPVPVEVWLTGPPLRSGWRGTTLQATQIEAIPLPPPR
jgi:hypothetical protein